MSLDEKIFIVGMARTAFGKFQGGLSSLSAPQLGAEAIKAALSKSEVLSGEVTEVIMGNVLTAGVGQAPARQAAIFAGLDVGVVCTTVNKVCGSGMKTLDLAYASLLLKASDIVVAGGMENMTQAPYLLKNIREGYRLGDQNLIDSMVHDGLTNVYDGNHMGICAEICAREMPFSREEQDAYAIESFKRAQKAVAGGKFNEEICPVQVKFRKGVETIKADEGPLLAKFDKIPKLRSVFDKNGSVTAANASTINDGACACVMMREETAFERGIKPLAHILGFSHHAQTYEWFTTAPIGAMGKLMAKLNWKVESVDLFEVNEAFAVVALSAMKKMGIPHHKMNVWGGAIAIGHPIGASGTRIVMNLISALQDLGKKRGIASICIGGGEAMAVAIEIA